ncbi:MAG: alpha/beta hydrolase [Verrucomicrobiota bacterium]
MTFRRLFYSSFRIAALLWLAELSCSGAVKIPRFELPVQNYAVIDICGSNVITDVAMIALDDQNHAAFSYRGTPNSLNTHTWVNGNVSPPQVLSPLGSEKVVPGPFYEYGGGAELIIDECKNPTALTASGGVYGTDYLSGYVNIIGYPQYIVGVLNVCQGFGPDGFIGGAELNLSNWNPLNWTENCWPSGQGGYFIITDATNSGWCGFGAPVATGGKSKPVDGVYLLPASYWQDEQAGASYSQIYSSGKSVYFVKSSTGSVYDSNGNPVPAPPDMNLTDYFYPKRSNANGWAIGTWEDCKIWNGQSTITLGSCGAEDLNDQNQIVGDGPDGGWFMDSDAAPNAEPMVDKLPDFMKGQLSGIYPFSISNQNQSGESPVADLDHAVQILARTDDIGIGEYPFLHCKRDHNKKWTISKVCLPEGTAIHDWNTINSSGIIAATGTTTWTSGANIHALLLLPVELGVDGNHDGVIQLSSASDQTTAEKPYKFWINNNHDGDCHDEAGVQDDLNANSPDSGNEYIACTRDLEDFSRIWISMKGVSQMLQGSSGISVGLQWESIPGASGPTPTIKMFNAVEQDGGTRYVTDNGSLPGVDGDNWNWSLEQVVSGTPVADVNHNYVLGSGTFILPKEFWSNFDDTHPKHLIFEGVTAGKGKLKLVFFDSSGNKIGEGGALYMDLRDIKNMYERWSCEQSENQNGEAPTGNVVRTNYRLPVGSNTPFTYGQNDPEEQKYILYVHGWNMAPFDKDAFAQTAFKRLWWQGYKGRFGAFQWPVTYHAFDLSAIWDFDDGEFTAWRSAVPLKGLLTTLNQHYGGNVYVFAHSMGNVVAGEALRMAAKSGAGQLVNTYVATQAAVPGHCYDMTLTGSNNLLDFGGLYGPSTPNIYNNWLGLTGSATGKKENFYNVNDFALNGTHWQLDQKMKPDIRTYTYYYDSDDISVIQDLFKKAMIRGSGTPTILHLGNSSDVLNRYEIMAFASEPRSKALGGVANVNGFVAQYLPDIWPADTFAQANGPYSAHPWHSAQFRFTNADQHKYWQALMERFGLPTNNP